MIEELLSSFLGGGNQGSNMYSPVYLSNRGYSTSYKTPEKGGFLEMGANIAFPRATKSVPTYVSMYDYNFMVQQQELRDRTLMENSYNNPIAIAATTKLLSSVGIDDKEWLMNKNGTPTWGGKMISNMFNQFLGDYAGPKSRYGEIQNITRDALRGMQYGEDDIKGIVEGILKNTYVDKDYTIQKGLFDYKDKFEILRMAKDYQVFRGAKDISKKTEEFSSVIGSSMQLFGTENKEEALQKLLEVTGGEIALTDTYKLKSAIDKVKDLARTANISVDLLREVVARGSDVSKQLGMSGQTGISVAMNTVEATRYMNRIPGATNRFTNEDVARGGGATNMELGYNDILTGYLSLPSQQNSAGILGIFKANNMAIPTDLINNYMQGTPLSIDNVLGNQDLRKIIEDKIKFVNPNISADELKVLVDSQIKNTISMSTTRDLGVEALNDFSPEAISSSLVSILIGQSLASDNTSDTIKNIGRRLQRGEKISDAEFDLITPHFATYIENTLDIQEQLRSRGIDSTSYAKQLLTRQSMQQEILEEYKKELPERTRAKILEEAGEFKRDSTTSFGRMLNKVMEGASFSDIFMAALPKEQEYIDNLKYKNYVDNYFSNREELTLNNRIKELTGLSDVDYMATPSNNVFNNTSLSLADAQKQLSPEDFLTYFSQKDKKNYQLFEEEVNKYKKMQRNKASMAIEGLGVGIGTDLAKEILLSKESTTLSKSDKYDKMSLLDLSKEVGAKEAVAYYKKHNKESFEKIRLSTLDAYSNKEVEASFMLQNKDQYEDIKKKLGRTPTLNDLIDLKKEFEDAISLPDIGISEMHNLIMLEMKDNEKTKAALGISTTLFGGRPGSTEEIGNVLEISDVDKIDKALNIEGEINLRTIQEKLGYADLRDKQKYRTALSNYAKLKPKEFTKYMEQIRDAQLSRKDIEQDYSKYESALEKTLELQENLRENRDKVVAERKEQFFNEAMKMDYSKEKAIELSAEEKAILDKDKDALIYNTKLYGSAYAARELSKKNKDIDLTSTGKLIGMEEYLKAKKLDAATAERPRDVEDEMLAYVGRNLETIYSDKELVGLLEGKGDFFNKLKKNEADRKEYMKSGITDNLKKIYQEDTALYDKYSNLSEDKRKDIMNYAVMERIKSLRGEKDPVNEQIDRMLAPLKKVFEDLKGTLSSVISGSGTASINTHAV